VLYLRSFAADELTSRTISGHGLAVRKAGLVLICAGRGEGLSWEIEQTVALVPPEMIVILVPFDAAVYKEFHTYYEPYFGHVLPEWIHEYRKVSTVLHAAVYFDPDWTGHIAGLIRHSTAAGAGARSSTARPVTRRSGNIGWLRRLDS
jgi:hypothetical protein